MKKGLIYFVFLISLSGCTVNRQVEEIKTLSKCEFSINSVEKIVIGGTDLKKIIQTGEINLTKMPALTLGFLSRNIPLNTSFILEITNPTANKAAISQFDYQLFINQQELVEGEMNEKIEILPGKSVLVPLEFSFNIYEFLASNAIDIQDFIQASENGEVKEVQLIIKIKPGILIGNQLVKYPSFITIEKTLNNEALLNL